MNIPGALLISTSKKSDIGSSSLEILSILFADAALKAPTQREKDAVLQGSTHLELARSALNKHFAAQLSREFIAPEPT